MHITELVYLYGDKAVDKIYEEIDERMSKYHDWLLTRNDLSEKNSKHHLANAHIFVEFLAEDSPCMFPEELIDFDDTEEGIVNETSTVFGLRQFIYCTYICKGPRPSELADAILESIRLYYEFLLDKGEVHQIPHTINEIVSNHEHYLERQTQFITLNEKFAEDEVEWNKAFDEWASSF